MRNSYGLQVADPNEDEKPYVHQPWPSWRYHVSGASKLVRSQEEADALGAGWRVQPYPTAPALFQQPQFQQPQFQQPMAPQMSAPNPQACPQCVVLAAENAQLRLTHERNHGDLTRAHESLQLHSQVLEKQNQEFSRQLADLIGQNASLQEQYNAALTELDALRAEGPKTEAPEKPAEKPADPHPAHPPVHVEAAPQGRSRRG